MYLDAFASDKEYVKELKEHYTRGGLGDVKVKKYLNEVLQAELEPIRNRRKEFAKDTAELYRILMEGRNIARETAVQNLN